MPKVSIVIPAFNSAGHIRRALESAFEQTWPDREVIVVDDGSTDDTAAVVRSFPPGVVQYIYQENSGAAMARNAGLANSAGEYVIFLDADDWWERRCLEILVAALEAQPPTCGAAHANWAYADSQGRAGMERDSSFSKGPGLRTLVLVNPFPIHAVLVRRGALEAIGGFTPEMPTLEDWELWLRLTLAGYGFFHVASRLAFYHWHPSTKSKNVSARKADRLATLDRLWRRADVPDEVRALQPQSYATAYIDFCVARLAQGNIELALREFEAAVAANRGSAISVDAFYRILYAEQAAFDDSRGGVQERLDEGSALRRVESILAYVSAAHRTLFTQEDIRSAYFAAYYALGLACYNERRLDQARRYFAKALTFRPEDFFRPIVGSTLLKSFLPPAFLNTGKELRRRLQ